MLQHELNSKDDVISKNSMQIDNKIINIHNPRVNISCKGGGGGGGAIKATGGSGGVLGETSTQPFAHKGMYVREIGHGGSEVAGGAAGFAYVNAAHTTVKAYPGICKTICKCILRMSMYFIYGT